MSTIAANDPNIIYSPYNWDVTATRAKTINAGAYLRLMFTGTPGTLAATFDVSNQPGGKTRLSIRVDQGPWQEMQIAASVPLTVPTNGWTSHTVEIVMRAHTGGVNRWNTPQPSAVLFTGLTSNNTITSRTTRRRALNGLAIGDSMGEGIVTRSLDGSLYEDNHDSIYSWAYPLGSLLGAEVGVVAFNGVAYGDNTGSTAGVPRAPLSVPYLWDGQARSLATVPDFIVVNLGTNDVLAAVSDANTTAYAKETFDWLLANTPDTTQIFAVPGWQNHKGAAIQSAVSSSTDPDRITFINTTDWWLQTDSPDNLHPYGYINTNDLSPRLAGVIRDKLDEAVAPGAINFYMSDDAGNPVPVVGG